MTSKQRRRANRSTGRIPSWVLLFLVGTFFLLVLVGTLYGVRLYAVFRIWEGMDNWDSDGVLVQQDRFSCVPCSIVMLLRDKKKEVSAAEVAWIAQTNMKGTDEAGIQRAGKHYGYFVRTEQLGFEEFMKNDKPGLVEFLFDGVYHMVYAVPRGSKDFIEVRNPSLGLSYVYRNGVQEYFHSNSWTVYYFE